MLTRNNKLLDKEKKRSDNLLLNILPEEVADQLKDTGKSAAKQFDDVTVLFTDFVNFTEAGERMKPEALIEELHTCFKKFDENNEQVQCGKDKNHRGCLPCSSRITNRRPSACRTRSKGSYRDKRLYAGQSGKAR